MKKLMCSQRRFFRSFFPMSSEPRFLFFENIKTGQLDIVVRSGDIICSVPPIKGRDFDCQVDLARAMVDGIFEFDFDLYSSICCVDQILRYDLEDCYYSNDDDFFAIIHPYNPDLFI